MHYHNAYLDVRKPRVTFDDIAGLEEVKEKIREMICIPLKHMKTFNKLNLKVPTGVFLWGPLGSGKAILAEASASEAGVNYVYLRGREVTDLPEAVSKAFKLARENKPCIMHISDLDWIVPRRNCSYDWGNRDERGKPDKIASKEVSEIVFKGIDSLKEDSYILVVGSGYRLDVVDMAIFRRGRLEKKIYVPPPSQEDRLKILKMYTKNYPLARDVNLEEIARKTENFVGWDLEALCRRAALNAIKERGDSFDEISMKDFLDAVHEIKPWMTQNIKKKYEEILRNDCMHKYFF
ncbi:MAG: ATP-binding protein [Candidatus Hydrothermarchaeota archaeon]